MTQVTRGETRIAWAIPSLNRGQYWQPIISRLARTYPRNRIFTGIFDGYLSGFENVFEVCRYHGGKVIPLGSTTLIWSSPSMLWHLARYRPAVMLTGGFNLATIYGLILRKVLGSKLVLLWDGVGPGTGVTRLDSPRTLQIRRWIGRQFDFAVSNSQEGASYLRDVIHMAPDKVIHRQYQLPDPAVVNLAAHSEDPLPEKRPRFLFVGEMVEMKGIRYLIKALSLLRKRGFSNFSCTFVGGGPDLQAFQHQTAEEGLDDIVHWAGRVPYSAIGSYFSNCDVFVFPTLDDIWGMVVLEAMVAGKPVICSKYAGARELVRDQHSGLITDPLNPEELADCMTTFLRTPELAREYGKNAAAFMSNYTPDHAARSLVEVIDTALMRPPEGPPAVPDLGGRPGTEVAEA